MTEEFEIHKVLVLGSGHVEEKTMDMLEELAKAEPISSHLIDYDYGAMIGVSTDRDYWPKRLDEDYPELHALYALAHSLGCSWLNLDCDGPVHENLPTFEWET